MTQINLSIPEKDMDRILRGVQTWIHVTTADADRIRNTGQRDIRLNLTNTTGGISNTVVVRLNGTFTREDIPCLVEGYVMLSFETAWGVSVQTMCAYLIVKRNTRRAWRDLQEHEGDADLTQRWLKLEAEEAQLLEKAVQAADLLSGVIAWRKT